MASYLDNVSGSTIEDLKENNILVRDRSQYIANSIRITIGKPDVMQAVTKIINRHEI